MKKHKRDKEERAYSRGYQVGISGKSRDLCPHTQPGSRQFWLSGWRQGRADHWDCVPPVTHERT